MNYKKLLLKALTLQCTVVKGSLLSLLLLAFSPIFAVVGMLIWIEDRAKNSVLKVEKVLNTRIPVPSIITEADQACDLNIEKYKHFLGLDK